MKGQDQRDFKKSRSTGKSSIIKMKTKRGFRNKGAVQKNGMIDYIGRGVKSAFFQQDEGIIGDGKKIE